VMGKEERNCCGLNGSHGREIVGWGGEEIEHGKGKGRYNRAKS